MTRSSTSSPVRGGQQARRGPRRWVTAGAFAAAASFLAGGCASWFGDENSAPRPFDVVITNDSNDPIYYAFGSADAAQPSGRFETVYPGESFSLGRGSFESRDQVGGCFRRPLWVLTSRSGQIYQQGDISEYADDLEIIRHFSPGECTDQEQIIVEYDGP